MRKGEIMKLLTTLAALLTVGCGPVATVAVLRNNDCKVEVISDPEAASKIATLTSENAALTMENKALKAKLQKRGRNDRD